MKSIQNHPLVSVVIPCYNHEQFVQECIQSVIDQDYQNIELIIIDDGSQDQSVQKIEEMRAPCEERFVRFEFRHRPNKGLCATLNEALVWCEGEYYTAIASDDIMLTKKTSIQLRELLNNKIPNVVGIFSGIEMFGDNINKIRKGENAIYQFDDIFLHNCVMTTPTIMFLRQKIIEVGGYNENTAIEDLDLFLKITSKGYVIKSVDTPVALYRRHNDNLSSRYELMLEAVVEILEQYKDHPLYTQALSKAFMVAAHSSQSYNKKDSWKYMVKAINICPNNFFSKSFVKYLIKSLIK